MLIYKTGDILNATENIICHQVNEDGVMGGGLARQIAKGYPNIENEYKKYCQKYDKENLFGQFQIVKTTKGKYIANCFTQRNFVTNLKDIYLAFNGLLESCKTNDLTIAIPFEYGCGIANGDWNEVKKVFERLSDSSDVDISIYKLVQKNEQVS